MRARVIVNAARDAVASGLGVVEINPAGNPAWAMAERIPGAKPFRRHRYELPRSILVPTTHWRAVWAAMPAIKSASQRYLNDRAMREEAATKRLRAGLPAPRLRRD